MALDFSQRCPGLEKHIADNDGSFCLDWLETHTQTCNYCQSIMRLVNGTVIADIRREVGGEMVADKLSEN